ncbi:MAG: ATP synthase epsilon chain [Parcubacteria group bacterium GW2011_GWA2_38_13]|nr:MAG: ATP synthase epsilon chain [Parcubacteria group bacterium GW2011_GWA2_38_13]
MIKFKIVTPERTVYEDTVDEVVVPTVDGEIAILPNHIPLISILQAGELRTKKGNEEKIIAVSSGFVQVNKNEVVILADTAEHADEIDEKRAEEAHERAKKLLEETKNIEEVDYTNLAAKLEKELARLKVARKKKYRDVGGVISKQ